MFTPLACNPYFYQLELTWISRLLHSQCFWLESVVRDESNFRAYDHFGRLGSHISLIFLTGIAVIEDLGAAQKDRQNGVLESVRVPKDKLCWSCLATGKRKDMVTLTHIIAPWYVDSKYSSSNSGTMIRCYYIPNSLIWEILIEQLLRGK